MNLHEKSATYTTNTTIFSGTTDSEEANTPLELSAKILKVPVAHTPDIESALNKVEMTVDTTAYQATKKPSSK